MRGKKTVGSNYYDEYRPERSVGYPESARIPNHEIEKKSSGKRKPLGFIGSRGKRDAFGSGDAYPKLSPYEFQGN